MKLRVKCTYFVDIEISDENTEDGGRFCIEENGCPGTGAMGAALEEAMAHAEEQSVCWACNLGGRCELVGYGDILPVTQ